MKSVLNYDQDKYSTLPKEGWFKMCYKCCTITSKYIIICDTYKYYYCKRCINNKIYYFHKIFFPDFSVEIFV